MFLLAKMITCSVSRSLCPVFSSLAPSSSGNTLRRKRRKRIDPHILTRTKSIGISISFLSAVFAALIISCRFDIKHCLRIYKKEKISKTCHLGNNLKCVHMIPGQLIAPAQLANSGVNFASVHGLTLVTVHMSFSLSRSNFERQVTCCNPPCRSNFSPCEQNSKVATRQE